MAAAQTHSSISKEEVRLLIGASMVQRDAGRPTKGDTNKVHTNALLQTFHVIANPPYPCWPREYNLVQTCLQPCEPLFARWITVLLANDNGDRDPSRMAEHDPALPSGCKQSVWVVLTAYHEQDPWWQTIRNLGKWHQQQHHTKVTDSHAPTSDPTSHYS